MTEQRKQEIAAKCRREILMSEWVQNLYPSSPSARTRLANLVLSAINEATVELEKESAEKSDNYRQQSEWCERLVKELNAYKLRAEQWELQYTELLKEVERYKHDSKFYQTMMEAFSTVIDMAFKPMLALYPPASHHNTGFIELVGEVCKEVEELRKDRERLDWLERIDCQKYIFDNWIGGGGTLRTAIDQAKEDKL